LPIDPIRAIEQQILSMIWPGQIALEPAAL